MDASIALRNQAQEVDAVLRAEVPHALRDVVNRHHEHLVILVDSLRVAGISDAVVEQSIDVLIDRYRTELSKTVAQLSRDGFDG